ncbi:TetR/AcrR family transcriptional regulator [Microbacterium gilvum]|uniref:TetR/AcrR family transcriptional regulator n=1 Tax=Microbacterium gilvum TaxID=1336204 RepID=A0ABP9AGB4_9MICO
MGEGGSKRGPYAVGVERRQRILAVAARRFSDAGYSQTSLAEIAREVGVTTPGLTHHFPTKQHLLLAIVEHRFDVAQQIAEAAEGEPDGTRTLRLLQSIADTFAADPGLIDLFVLVSAETADPSSPAHELFARRYERVVEDIAGLFDAEAEAGALRRDIDYRALARECIAVSDGLQLQWVVTGGRIDFSALIRNHLDRIAPAIAARRARPSG